MIKEHYISNVVRNSSSAYLQTLGRVQNWAHQNIINLFIFNIILTALLLLRSAGYFSPFFPLSISLIIIICLALSVILLGARSRVLFTTAVLFWLVAIFLKVAKVDIWAERAAIYTFEALLLGLFIFLFEKNYHDEDNR